MDNNRQRALRRHHMARIKAKRIDHYGGYIRQLTGQEQKRHIGIHAHTAKVCSCWMCGNPRRHLRAISVQERRAGIEQLAAQSRLL